VKKRLVEDHFLTNRREGRGNSTGAVQKKSKSVEEKVQRKTVLGGEGEGVAVGRKPEGGEVYL